MANRSYHDQFKIDSNIKLREQVSKLPGFCSLFFRGIEPTTSERTRNAYAYDLFIFFNYIKAETGLCDGKDITEYEIELLDKITPTMIQDFLEYLKVYNNTEETERINSERGQMRKLSTLRSFYNYFYRMEKIRTNPASIVPMPKLREKNIVRLDSGEIVDLLNEVETGNNMSKSQQKFHEKTKVRDIAIITLLLGTGIRVSECVGLDLNDLDFKNHGIRIIRKGGKEVVVYFGDEVENALFDYIRERNTVVPLPGHENALFLSLQKRRISVRAIQNLVEKYASQSVQLKHITPHKLRSTYGTQLYRETGDIYLVADVLGHSDVNTTKKHYAAIEDERRRSARNMVTLRGDAGQTADSASISISDTDNSASSGVSCTELSATNNKQVEDNSTRNIKTPVTEITDKSSDRLSQISIIEDSTETPDKVEINDSTVVSSNKVALKNVDEESTKRPAKVEINDSTVVSSNETALKNNETNLNTEHRTVINRESTVDNTKKIVTETGATIPKTVKNPEITAETETAQTPASDDDDDDLDFDIDFITF